MLRAYSSSWDGGNVLPKLDREEVHHLVRVRRVRIGEIVEILNGKGHVGSAEVLSVDGTKLGLNLRAIREIPESRLQVHLLVALPKGKTFPGLLHKAVELGVSRITPLATENVEVPPERAGKKQDRWESVLIEALKQSGNPWMPRLDAPSSLDKELQGPADAARICAALQPDASPLWQLLGNPLKPVGVIQVFVGPEGDFSDAEYKQLRGAGCHFVSLGPLVLKVETAASLVMGALQLWSQGA
ncbi:16S rRNA (uracil(1498)-N(3))-methyltransferase [Puniceicoccales bacterium CK1056]|uniref:Ribosomal RNA small subunit methyltransferase E n=1 Tax=Oceanipulchritudo coccoides TaxID=2706888 RepID=A0A6B2LZ90_9BACT|nr:16S rRNA (uracil(1498)-N(3))-methyltransferase [Oceanipulchritudo coccoides]NDV60850.1 16S rRNA (uracil(1498)-N(3))-methyltransferase [Oceanipulchritudo coccoides]